MEAGFLMIAWVAKLGNWKWDGSYFVAYLGLRYVLEFLTLPRLEYEARGKVNTHVWY